MLFVRGRGGSERGLLVERIEAALERDGGRHDAGQAAYNEPGTARGDDRCPPLTPLTGLYVRPTADCDVSGQGTNAKERARYGRAVWWARSHHHAARAAQHRLDRTKDDGEHPEAKIGHMDVEQYLHDNATAFDDSSCVRCSIRSTCCLMKKLFLRTLFVLGDDEHRRRWVIAPSSWYLLAKPNPLDPRLFGISPFIGYGPLKAP